MIAQSPAHVAHGFDLEVSQFERLRAQLEYCYEKSEFYRRRFDAIGFAPWKLRSIDEFRRLDLVMDKEDERVSEADSQERFGHPFGMHLCADPEDVLGVSASSGTTGEPTFTYLFTQDDLQVNDEVWRRALTWMGVEPGDLVLHAMGLSMWVVGSLAVRSLINIGIRPLPVGAEAGAVRVLQIAARTRPPVLLATPSMAERLIEQSEDVTGMPASALGIRRLMCLGEPGAGLPEVRERIESGFEAQLFDAMLGAWGACQVSCDAGEYAGMHQLSPDFIYWELVDPETYEPIEHVNGARGRALATTLRHEARPVVRFDMGDMCEIYTEPCICGKGAHQRIRVLGRADDMLIVGGVNVYASAVKDVIASYVPDVSGAMRLVLPTAATRVKPPVRTLVEIGADSSVDHDELAGRIERRLKEVLRFRADVEFVPYQSLPRSTGKTQLVIVKDRERPQ